MEREARAFTVALRNPHEPSVCAACLACFLDYIHANGLKENLRILRMSHHNLLGAAMVFITTPRTDASREETHRAIGAALSQCSIPSGRRNQHSQVALALLAGHNLLYIVIDNLCDLVDYCLRESDLRIIHSQRFSSRGLWPCSTEDLLPVGREQSLLSLIHWLAVREHTRVMIAFDDIFLTCRDEMCPLIMKDTNRHLFANAISHQMQDALRGLKKDRAEGNLALPGNFSPLDRIFTLCGVLSNVMRALSPNQDLPSSAPIPLVKGHERDVLDSIEEAITLVEHGPERNRLISLATTLHGSLGTPFKDRPGDLQIPLLAMQSLSGPAVDLVLRLIAKLRQRHQCAAADCTAREREDGRRLQCCGRCRIVQYCSTECQERHWKAVETPHKAVCASLKRLAPFLALAEQDFRQVRAMNLDYDQLASIYVNVQHGNVPTFTEGLRTTAQKVEEMSKVLRMYDSLLRNENTPSNLNAVRDALTNVGIGDFAAE